MMLSKFLANAKGNVALIFAVLALPMVIVTGASIELARINDASAELQGITDSAVLAAAQASPEANEASKNAADLYMQSHIAGSKITIESSWVSNSSGKSGPQLNYGATGTIESLILNIIGKKTFEISTKSSILTNIKGTEVVFVLDTTGSMAMNNKMVELKKAVNAVLDGIVDSSGTNLGDMKVGVVPFNTQVKVDPGTTSLVDMGEAKTTEGCLTPSAAFDDVRCIVQWWNTDIICNDAIDPTACQSHIKFYETPVTSSSGTNSYEQIAVTYEQTGATYIIRTHHMSSWWLDGTCLATIIIDASTSCTSYSGSSGLTDDTQTDEVDQPDLTKYDTIPSGYTLMTEYRKWNVNTAQGYGASASQIATYNAFNSNVRRAITPPTPPQTSTWVGCFADRYPEYDVSADSPDPVIPNSQYRANGCMYEPLSSILPLTDDITKVREKVNGFSPAGNTNVTIGTQWGVELLSPTLPFDQGGNWNDIQHQKYIILVTDGYNTANDFTNVTSDIDKRTELMCQNAKAKGIVLFVIRLQDGDPNLLRNCATKPKYFYNVVNSEDLTPTFKNIFKNINLLRIVQ